METRTLADLRAADQDLLYRMYFPDDGRVRAAAVVGCVCHDHLTCSECERILGQSFLAIELAARNKQRTDPPVPVARVDAVPGQGLGRGSHGVEGSDAAVSGMVDRLVSVSHPPSDGLSDAAAGMVDRFVPCSHPPSDEVEGSDAAVSGMVDRLVPGSHPPSDGVSYAAESMAVRLVPGSHPPSDGVSVAAEGMAVRLVPGSHPPSDGVEGSDAAISSMADRLAPSSQGGVEGFEPAISGMAARLGLAAAVGERAKEVFRKIEKARAWPYRPGRTKEQSKGPLAYAACLSIACRTEGSALSLRELALAAVAGGGPAARKEIFKLVGHIRKRLGEEGAGQATGIGMVSVSSYLSRFSAYIRLGEAEKAAALEAARRFDEGALDVPHMPDSVAAAVVCLALERAGARKPGVKDVAAAIGLPKMTIYAVCRNLRPHAELLFD